MGVTPDERQEWERICRARIEPSLPADASAEDVNLEGERRNPDPLAADVVSALSE